MRLIPARKVLEVESEEGQALFRFQSTLLVTLCVMAALLAGRSDEVPYAVPGVLAYLAFAYAWTWLVAIEWGRALKRQWSALLLDHVVFSAAFAWGGLVLAPLVWVPITISVGHGLRFGERRTYAASLLGSSCIFGAMMYSPRWPVSSLVSAGVALAALIAPIYVVRLVRTIAVQRAAAESRARQLEAEVCRDPLTKLLNRSGIDRVLKDLTDSQGHAVAQFGLIAVDLDGFKAVNDTLGHEAGDAVLKAVGAQLTASVRASDAVARMGGDEFTIVLMSPGGVGDLELVAAKILRAVQAVRPTQHSDLSLGASLGVCLVERGASVVDAARTADRLMYAAKRGGKGQHRVALVEGEVQTT